MKDVKKELPKGWRWVKLGDVGKLSQGGTPSTEILDYWHGSIPFITGADVTSLYVSKGRSFLTETGLNSGKTERCEKGDLLIVSRTRVGRIGIADAVLGISQDVSVIKLKKDYDTKYLAIFLKSISHQLAEACQGATIKGLTRGYIESIQIPLPPTIEDQIAIANELERKMAEVEAMRQAALRQKDACGATEGAILREVFPPKEQSKLPNGWKWKKLSEVCFINPTKKKGFTRESSLQTTFVPMDAIDETTGRISKIITRPYSEISKGYTFFEEGDVLFAKITPCMQNGKSAIINNLTDKVGFGSTEFHVLRPKPDITKEWAFFFVRTKEFRKRSEDHFEGSAGQQRVPVEFLENSLIPVPSTITEQKVITGKIEQKLSQVESIRQGSEKQLDAIEAMPGAILREVFDFGKN